jgi:hypothetical protein
MSHEEKPPSGCLVLFLVLYTIVSAPIILAVLNIFGIPIIAGHVAVAAATLNKYLIHKSKK